MEVILCLGLFAVVVVVLFSVIGGGISMQRKAEVVELASSVARQQIEGIKSEPGKVVEGVFDGRTPTAPTAQGFPPEPYPKVQRGRDFWTLVEVSASDDRLWYLRVRVFSDDGELTAMETLLKR
jgi:hypothetical protein